MSLDGYWKKYDETLARVKDEKPDTFDKLKVILDDFEPPSSGEAFFPGGADENLGEALGESGWDVRWIEGDYLWTALHPETKEELHYVEGDLYRGRWLPVR
ncbi:hypothetical protein [Leifsonia aquatica]|uniref:hypothetical protein n=1 Tax=Leifsonia aquatica TaxID=144185 RepID=UPI00046ACB67|nr:hypothetical protein [Leifsonia aquatica]